MTPFEQIKHEDEDGTWWSARELGEVLGYAKWDKFSRVIEKAMIACHTSRQQASDHFLQAGKMVQIGSGAEREIEDWHLSRYACYLIVQNADPEKHIVALGQTYFAVRTREAELADDLAQLTEAERRLLLRDRVKDENTTLAAVAYGAGVLTAQDFGIFQDHGYKGLYDGETAADIRARKGLRGSQRILDWMGSEELAANYFRITQTEAKIAREGITEKDRANEAHHDMGRAVRQFISDQGGTMPEDLPTPEKSIQQLKRQQQKRVQSGPTLWDDEATDG